jgi:hypothetical protein
MVALLIIVCFMLVLTGRLQIHKKPAIFEIHKRTFIIAGALALCYPLFEIAGILLKWK